MSIKATQPEDNDATRDAYVVGGVLGLMARCRHLEAQLAALATPSPQPAEAKTAAVDGMTDAKRYRWLRASVGNPAYVAFSGPWGIGHITGNRLDKAIDAAIATQEGGR